MVTNTPEKISDFGVIHTGISDHSLIFAIRKISVIKKQENIVEMRNMKNFKVTGHPFRRFVENRYCALKISPIFIKFSPNVSQCMQNMIKL
jgi:hypothetical protein